MTPKNVNSCERKLLKTLVDSFPHKIGLNYFELSGISPTQAVWGDEEVEAARHLMSSLSLMRSQNLLDADLFLDGERHYLWNVCLRVDAYEAFKKRLPEFISDPAIEFRDILGAILQDVKMSDRHRSLF